MPPNVYAIVTEYMMLSNVYGMVVLWWSIRCFQTSMVYGIVAECIDYLTYMVYGIVVCVYIHIYIYILSNAFLGLVL